MNSFSKQVVDWIEEIVSHLPDGEEIVVLLILFGWVPVVAFFLRYIIRYLGRPRRRQEQVRLFVDLIETGMAEGMTETQALNGLAGCDDKSLNPSLSTAISAVAYGDRVSEALRKEPLALPPRAVELIAAGERLGDIRKVLPLVRQWCGDESARMAAMFQHPVAVLVGALPMYVVISLFLKIVIIPKFAEIAADFHDGGDLKPFTDYTYQVVLPGFDLLAVAGFVLLLFGYAAVVSVSDSKWGPRLRWCKRLVDGWVYRLPWRRDRFNRDFATVLAMLLDAGVNEVDAVRLAAACTDNIEIERRAGILVGRLASGERLTDALSALDDQGDLAWRWTTASQGQPGLVMSLRGWSEVLSARADRTEQAVAHVVSSVTVLAIGFLVLNLMLAVWIPLMKLQFGEWMW